MTEKQWRECLGELVRDYIRSPELERYFAVRMTKARAAIMVTQQSHFVRHRRHCWANVSANCPVMAVKQRILEHEYEEIVKDDFSEYGHLHLILCQGQSVGLAPDEILDSQPLPATMAALYAWSWMTRTRPWTESLTAMTITEWSNDDRLLGDLGGGQSTRMAKKWMDELGFTWKEIPNLQAHSQADEKHSDMFLPFLAEHATGDKEPAAVRAARESLDLNAMFREGIARAQEKIGLE
jgi:pyrroloquinoline quinone (PQQ) biosynthesis protein C